MKNCVKMLRFSMHVATHIFQKFNDAFFEILIFSTFKGGLKSKFCFLDFLCTFSFYIVFHLTTSSFRNV